MIGAVTSDDLLPAGEHAGNLDGILIRLRATQRKEALFQIARCDLSQQAPKLPPHLRSKGRSHVQKAIRLLLDGRHDTRMTVADVDVHQLRGKVQVTAALDIPQVYPLRSRYGDRIDRPLCHPGKDSVLTVQANDFFLVHITPPLGDAPADPLDD